MNLDILTKWHSMSHFSRHFLFLWLSPLGLPRPREASRFGLGLGHVGQLSLRVGSREDAQPGHAQERLPAARAPGLQHDGLEPVLRRQPRPGRHRGQAAASHGGGAGATRLRG